MDPNNPVVKLCIEGTWAEFEGRLEVAHRLYQEAGTAARDDFEACIAAHYVAHHRKSQHDKLRWNLEALARAEAVGDEMGLQKRFFGPEIPLPDFAEHPADGFVDQIFPVSQQYLGQLQRFSKLASFDEMEGRHHGNPSLPQAARLSQMVKGSVPIFGLKTSEVLETSEISLKSGTHP